MQQFSDLVGKIYDAALSPDQWPATLQTMANAFDACFAGFGWEDTRVMAVGGSYGNQQLPGLEGETYRNRYKQTLVYSNPMRVPVLLTQEVDDVFTPGMLVPAEEYRASRYYREYVEPMGWGDGLSSILSKSDGVVHFLAFARRAVDPPFGDPDIELLKLLTPHVRRAYTIGNLIGRQQARVEELAQTFDGLVAAVFLVDPRGRVTYRNESATALLALGKPLAVINERLCQVGGAMNVPFERVLHAALYDDTGTAQGSVILEGSGEARHLVHMLPLVARRARKFDAAQSAVAIFVTKVGLEVGSPIKTIAHAFGLTPREMSIVVALVDTGNPAEVAARLGVTANTVKSHLKAIFHKSGVSRQGDLVKLVASYVSPVQPR